MMLYLRIPLDDGQSHLTRFTFSVEFRIAMRKEQYLGFHVVKRGRADNGETN